MSQKEVPRVVERELHPLLHLVIDPSDDSVWEDYQTYQAFPTILTDAQQLDIQALTIVIPSPITLAKFPSLGKMMPTFQTCFQSAGARFLFQETIGRLPKEFTTIMQAAMERTKHNTRLTLIFAMRGSGRRQIVHAIHEAALEDASLNSFDEETVDLYFSELKIPPIDAVLHMGELNGAVFSLSDAGTWQRAYAEDIVTSRPFHALMQQGVLGNLIAPYYSRNRKFGGLPK